VKQISAITSAERSELLAFICAISAIFVSIPPMAVFPHISYKAKVQ